MNKMKRLQITGVIIFKMAILISVIGWGSLHSQTYIFPDTVKGIIMHWNPNTEPDLAGYVIKFTTSQGSTSYIPVGLDTIKAWTMSQITNPLWLSVAAFDRSGNQADYSPPTPIKVKFESVVPPVLPPPSTVDIPYIATDFQDWHWSHVVQVKSAPYGPGVYLMKRAWDDIGEISRSFSVPDSGLWNISFRFSGDLTMEIARRTNITKYTLSKVYETSFPGVWGNASFNLSLKLNIETIAIRFYGDGLIEMENEPFSILKEGVDTTSPALVRFPMVKSF
jgi:hypothetical protein